MMVVATSAPSLLFLLPPKESSTPALAAETRARRVLKRPQLVVTALTFLVMPAMVYLVFLLLFAIFEASYVYNIYTLAAFILNIVIVFPTAILIAAKYGEYQRQEQIEAEQNALSELTVDEKREI